MSKQKTSASSIKKNVRQVLRRIEDFFIPPLCVICDEPTSDNWFCEKCKLVLINNHNSRDACPRCSQNRRKKECACEFAWDFPFERVVSAYDYDDTISAIAQHIKYKGKSRLAYHVGFITAPLLPPDCAAGIDAVIPVPLHKIRQRKRGYNQAEHFARGLIKGLGINEDTLSADLLTRVKNTGTQTKLDREDRMKNLGGAFKVAPNRAGELAGKTVMLVDDIFTTGATTEACTNELLGAGCAAVRVVAMGRR